MIILIIYHFFENGVSVLGTIAYTCVLTFSFKKELSISSYTLGCSVANTSIIEANFLGSTPIRVPKVMKSSLHGVRILLRV